MLKIYAIGLKKYTLATMLRTEMQGRMVNQIKIIFVIATMLKTKM